jgi:hypothetical protein
MNMQAKADYQLRLAQEYRMAQITDASNANRIRRRSDRATRNSIRRSIGHQIMRIGARLAAEPAPKPARAQ